MDLSFAAVPHDEAIALIRSMPVVAREVFDQLAPELKAAVFTVKGVALASDRQAIRDLIAEKFDGKATFESQRKKVIAVLKANDFKDKAAARRADFLLRHFSGVAYSAARYRLALTQTDLFPWWQYLSMADTKVRASHAALNGIILRWDSPFWQTHLPPWEPLCRCSWRMLSDFDVEEIIREDADKPEDRRRVLAGPMLDRLLDGNSLMRSVELVDYENGVAVKRRFAPAQPYDLRTPADRGQSWIGWRPDNIVPTKQDLETKLPPEAVKELMAAAAKQEAGGATVAEWIEGKPQAARENPKAKPARAKKPAAPGDAPAAAAVKLPPVQPVSAKPEDQMRAKLLLETGDADTDRKVEEATGFISAVHSVSGMLATPVRARRMRFEALYDPRYPNASARLDHPEVFETTIYLKKNQKPNRTDILHEMAHKIEGEAIAVRFADMGDPEHIFHRKGWQAWQKIVEALNATNQVNEINYSTLALENKQYLTNRCELFARGYAQYIAMRTGNAELIRELDAARERFDGLWQWPDDEFAPIISLYDALFRALGWIKRITK